MSFRIRAVMMSMPLDSWVTIHVCDTQTHTHKLNVHVTIRDVPFGPDVPESQSTWFSWQGPWQYSVSVSSV